MSAVADDITLSQDGRIGLLLAIVSAGTFGMSGALAGSLLATGWSPGAIVLARVTLGSVALTPFAVRAMRGRWHAVRRHPAFLLAYGAVAVAGVQFCYFSAVQRMDVGPALLVEYTAPAAVVAYLWLRHGQRPGGLTLLGVLLAAAGLVLVLDLVGGVSLSGAGIAWSLVAMVGAAAYFVMNTHETGIPPIGLAWLGLTIGAVFLLVLGVVHGMPLRTSTEAATLAGARVGWLVPVVLLGIITAAVAYAAGIAAGRRLGSRLASFVALFEVVSAVLFAWLLLDQLPRPLQVLGGLLILAGVMAVNAGEPERRRG